MDLIILLETYLHGHSLLVYYDRLVVNCHDCIGDLFGNIGVKMLAIFESKCLLVGSIVLLELRLR